MSLRGYRGGWLVRRSRDLHSGLESIVMNLRNDQTDAGAALTAVRGESLRASTSASSSSISMGARVYKARMVALQD